MAEQPSGKTNWAQILAALITAAATIVAALVAVRAKQEKTDLGSQIVALRNQVYELQTAKQQSALPDSQNALPNALGELGRVKQENSDLENRNAFLTSNLNELQKKLDASQSTRSAGSAPPEKPQIHLPPKDSVRTVGIATFAYNAGEVTSFALYKCRKDGMFIVCYFVVTRVNGATREYDTSRPFLFSSKLVDTFNNDHPLVREYFIDGRGNQQKHVNLAKDETSWYAQEFGDARPDVTAGRIAFGFGNIHTPVE